MIYKGYILESTSKHVSMPRWMHDRVCSIAEQTGAPFSKIVQAALREKLPQLEEELGGFQIDPMQLYENE